MTFSICIAESAKTSITYHVFDLQAILEKTYVMSTIRPAETKPEFIATETAHELKYLG